MTIAEMHTGFKVELDKTSSLELPAFEPEEIDYWLNLAQKRFIEDRVNLFIEGRDKEFVLSKIEDELRPIIVSRDPLTPGETLADLTYTHWFTLNIFANITKDLEDGTTASGEEFPCDIITESEKKKFMETSVNKLYFDNPKYIIGSDESTSDFELITDAFTTTVHTIYVSYIREAVEIVLSPAVNCELPESVHHNIISLAVKLALENIESLRFQTNSMLVNNNE